MRIILAFLTSALLSPALSAATFISADDSGILYTGRWDQTNSAEPWAFAKGTSVMANFNHTSVAVRLSATTTDYVRFIINGDAAGSVKAPLTIGTDSYPLGAGVHKVEIVKETAAGRMTFHGFNLDDGTSPDDAEVLAAPPSRPLLKLVFYGDSNLSGYSLEDEQNQSGRNLQGSYYGFAGIASRMLDAEYSNISRSGASIRSLHAAFDRIDWGSPGTSWYFPKFQPDAVIINIGANDVGRPKSKFKKDYRALLNDMRVAYPDAHIMLFNAWGWDYAEPANFIHEVIEGMGDENMSSAKFPWLFEQWHGCEYDHSGMAHVLVEHLKNVLTLTTPVNKADVMNGYGMNGDVANGGFEEVAPFGGFGWRYYTDAGVDRVEESGPRRDSGKFFLRLEGGAAVHQPNPARGGDTFTVTAWVRGSDSTSSLDTLHVTIDFRDQNMWTEPLETETFTFDLSTSWQKKTMTAIAPVGGSNPVFHTRLTFQAGNGSRVDIDDVEMRVGADACVDADPDCSSQQCISLDKPCSSNQDCCSGRCSKGKPSSRACL